MSEENNIHSLPSAVDDPTPVSPHAIDNIQADDDASAPVFVPHTLSAQDDVSAIDENTNVSAYHKETDTYYRPNNESHSETVALPVPGVDEEYYEDAFGLVPQNMGSKEALEFAAQQGLASTLRENASLTQSAKSLRRQVLLSMLVNIALSALVVAMIFAFASYPKNRYIATKDNSAICEVKPQDNPNITDAGVTDFAKEGVLNLYSFDYANYANQVDDTLGRWFTNQGRVDTVAALNASGILDYANKKALVLKAGATQAARIEQKGIGNNGLPFWIVRFPMVIDIYAGGDKPTMTQKHLVTVKVVADTASASNPRGLGISSVTLTPQS